MKTSLISIALIIFHIKFIDSKLETPSQFLAPGIVTVLSEKCKHSKKLTEFLNANKIPYTPIYLEKDEDALHFIMKECKGKVPWVYENGVLVGDGYALMARYSKANPEMASSHIFDHNQKKMMGFKEGDSRRQSTLLYDGKEIKLRN